jgi:hypothetical protein
MKTIKPPCKANAKPREVSRLDLMHVINRDERALKNNPKYGNVKLDSESFAHWDDAF